MGQITVRELRSVTSRSSSCCRVRILLAVGLEGCSSLRLQPVRLLASRLPLCISLEGGPRNSSPTHAATLDDNWAPLERTHWSLTSVERQSDNPIPRTDWKA